MSEGGQQRAFANRIKLQSAQEIRQSATATVKAATEKVHKIARSTVQPITLAVVRAYPIYSYSDSLPSMVPFNDIKMEMLVGGMTLCMPCAYGLLGARACKLGSNLRRRQAYCQRNTVIEVNPYTIADQC